MSATPKPTPKPPVPDPPPTPVGLMICRALLWVVLVYSGISVPVSAARPAPYGASDAERVAHQREGERAAGVGAIIFTVALAGLAASWPRRA